MKPFLKTSWVAIAAIIALSCIVLWPLARAGFYVTDDGEWMVIRLSAFYQSLREGQFPVRFLGRLNHSYGYPVPNFLYPGYLYIGSLLHLLGASFVDSVKLVMAAAVVGTAVIMFFWIRRSRSYVSALVGVASFLFAPYLAFDLYVRGSVGEVLSLLPASLVFYAADANKKWILPIAFAALILSHNTLAFIFTGCFIAYTCYRRRWEALPFMFLGFGAAAFFWVPALLEKSLVVFDSIPIANPLLYFASGEKIWLIGFPTVLAAVFLIFQTRHKKSGDTKFFLVLIVLTMFFATPMSFALWQYKPLASLVQFPYRLLAVGLIAGPYLIASCWDSLPRRWRFVVCVGAIVIWIVPLSRTLGGVNYVRREEGYYTTNEATTTVADEYMPRWVRVKPGKRADEKLTFVLGHGTVQYLTHSTQRIVANIVAAEDSTIQLNTLYYPGWGITIDDQTVPIRYDNSGGVMQVVVKSGHHTFLSEFRETISRFIADAVSFVSVIVYIIGVIRYARQRQRRQT